MRIGIIGLGRMGQGIAHRVLQAGYHAVGFDLDVQACALVADMGVTIAPDIASLARQVDVVWIIVPAGPIVDKVLASLKPVLTSSTVVIDGGNSKFTDSMRRAQELLAQGVAFLDCGTSGGLHGKEIGFSLMVGGDQQAYTKVLPLLQAIAAPDGVGYVGPSGAGHYVKMVHNGIEYALLQAYAEGFQLIKEGTFKHNDLDLAEITRIWNNGSIIRSWIVHLSHDIFEKDQTFAQISGKIEESGTGQWTVEEAHAHKVPVKLIEDALKIRAESRTSGGNYATKIVALLRHAFGGHRVVNKS
ncbi:MAG TPA: decarboxylating 6-phosphogluconate dehydrogenase [Candidatus Limnocylindria bacterium]|nr:decarboxylating 6-phosphogluconate dehydrogenase [Candidatus Limnocylindria bacterium]